MLCWGGFEPDALPDATARRVEDVRGFQRLFAQRGHGALGVCRVVDKDEPVMLAGKHMVQTHVVGLQLIVSIRVDILGHIDGELKVSSAMEGGILAVDKDGGLVVHSSKVEQHAVTVPVFGDGEAGGQP